MAAPGLGQTGPGLRGSSGVRKRGQPAIGRAVSVRSRTVALLAALLLTVPLTSNQRPVSATPASPATPSLGQLAQAAPGWLTTESAARLDLAFPVLVPGAIPGPFGGEPSIYAAGGYYSLYWVLYGAAPTSPFSRLEERSAAIFPTALPTI